MKCISDIHEACRTCSAKWKLESDVPTYRTTVGYSPIKFVTQHIRLATGSIPCIVFREIAC
jgi:hypothetical protein